MTSDIHPADSPLVAAGDPSTQPFDPPGTVRITEELRFRYSDDRRPRLNQYLRSHRVGRGQHGEVWVCWDLSNDRREVAIKAVKRNNPRAEKMNRLRRRNLPTSPHTPLTDKLGSLEQKIRKEIAIMKKCRHGHIVRLLEVIDDKLNERIYMVMEYLSGGEIKWRNDRNEPILQVDQCRRICRDVILGLEYLHYQGIIHRDIKPANLLWTADRQMVKITDFGVSHFSYAQRLAAAGRGQVALDDPNDPILLDDSDLSKRAGTPPFLAPEVIAEYASTDTSPSASTLLSSTSLTQASTANANAIISTTNIQTTSTIRDSTPLPARQPITKAIDVWALGVTLYCLLFGHIPFRAPGGRDASEYVLYHTICNYDWEPDETMGYDKMPTGGRHPPKPDGNDGDAAEAWVVMNLLDRFLQKDVRKRITLDDAKRYPWFLRDIPRPEEWLSQTSPSRNDIVMVTESETQTAMTIARFSWGWHKRLTNRISTLLKGVKSSSRPPASQGPTLADVRKRVRDEDENRTLAASSSPALSFGRPKSSSTHTTTSTWMGGHHHDEEHKARDKDKGKRHTFTRPHITRNDSTPNMATTRRRDTSIERWVARSSGMERRPKSSGKAEGVGASVPSSPSTSASPQSQPQLDQRTRHRFSLSSMKYWRPSHKTASRTNSQASSTSPLDTETASSSASVVVSQGMNTGETVPKPQSKFTLKSGQGPSMDITNRRSDEVLRYSGRGVISGAAHAHVHAFVNDADCGGLTAARRASSWGEPVSYARSVNSVDHDHEHDALDEDAMFLGAGGVCNDLNTLVSSNLPMGLGRGSGGRQPQPQLQMEPGVYHHHSQQQQMVRSTTTSPSPLQYVTYGSDLNRANEIEGEQARDVEDRDDGDDDDDGYGSYGSYVCDEDLDSDSSFFRDTHRQRQQMQSHSEGVFRANASLMYAEEDEESEEEEIVPLEVKRRRPSVSLAVGTASPRVPPPPRSSSSVSDMSDGGRGVS